MLNYGNGFEKDGCGTLQLLHPATHIPVHVGHRRGVVFLGSCDRIKLPMASQASRQLIRKSAIRATCCRNEYRKLSRNVYDAELPELRRILEVHTCGSSLRAQNYSLVLRIRSLILISAHLVHNIARLPGCSSLARARYIERSFGAWRKASFALSLDADTSLYGVRMRKENLLRKAQLSTRPGFRSGLLLDLRTFQAGLGYQDFGRLQGLEC